MLVLLAFNLQGCSWLVTSLWAMSLWRQYLITKQTPHDTYLELELFDVYRIDFMGQFVSSYGIKYILVVVDNVLKWVEVIVFPNIIGRSVTSFLKKNILSLFFTPHAIISNGGLHFYNSFFKALLEKYYHNPSWSPICDGLPEQSRSERPT